MQVKTGCFFETFLFLRETRCLEEGKECAAEMYCATGGGLFQWLESGEDWIEERSLQNHDSASSLAAED
jgi:hypothetical protein